jgi:hypothetical protein
MLLTALDGPVALGSHAQSTPAHRPEIGSGRRRQLDMKIQHIVHILNGESKQDLVGVVSES